MKQLASVFNGVGRNAKGQITTVYSARLDDGTILFTGPIARVRAFVKKYNREVRAA